MLSPSGATAYMTRPRAMPAPVPAVSVAGAIRDRREVIQSMAATYSATRTRNTISGGQWLLRLVHPAISRYRRRSTPPRGGALTNCSTVVSAGIRARNPA